MERCYRSTVPSLFRFVFVLGEGIFSGKNEPETEFLWEKLMR